MDKFGRSQPVKRVEDVRFMTGRGRYVDDVAPQGALCAYFLRSSVGHGVITKFDVSDARDAPGVHLVVTAGDLRAAGVRLDMKSTTVSNRDGSTGAYPDRLILADGKVRHVGEAIALIVTDSMAEARDAAEMLWPEIDDLAAKIDVFPGGATLHDEAPDNVAFDWVFGDGDAVDAAMATAAHVVSVEVPDNRIIVNSMEPRGCYAEVSDGRLHVAVNGQGVWGARGDLARQLKMPIEDIRVTNPDVGGGFGMKGMSYPEMFAIAHAARTLGKPVHWMSDRTEAMLSDNGGRDLTSTATLAFDADYRILGYKVETLANLGAYNSQFAQAIQTVLFSKVAPGTYDFQAIRLECKGIYTNTNPVDAYRGAGRPEAIFVLERAMDNAARVLGVDPWDLRRRNFIRPDQFPYTSISGMAYDVGEFDRLLTRAEHECDRAGFAARRDASARKGNLRGLGLCYYIESILGDPDETTRVDFNADGTVSMYVGTQSNGQGHETVYAAFLSDQTGIPADAIHVVQGDSDLIPKGGGTGGSRSVTVQNTATLATVQEIVTGFTDYLSDREGVPAKDINFDDVQFRMPGSNLTPTLLEVAELARQDGRDDLLSTSKTTTIPNGSFPNGAHVAEVEVDGETGVVRVDRYTVVDDFGNLINPMLAEGQVHGGVAQGLGQALTERVVFDEDAQLLTATFMDYAMPRADDLPMIDFHSEPVPSKYNPMGMKGCGEAGTVGALAAITNAVIDALGDRPGAAKAAMPFTPHRVWQWLKEDHGTAA